MSWLWTLIVEAMIGAVTSVIISKESSMGCVTNTIAGLVDSSIGQTIFGEWGLKAAGMTLTPSILGAVILVTVVLFFFGERP